LLYTGLPQAEDWGIIGCAPEIAGIPLRRNRNNESFNGKFRDGCPSLEWFRSRHDASFIVEARGRLKE